eukprot:417171_1
MDVPEFKFLDEAPYHKMDTAYEDNYWNDQGQSGIHGQGNVYADNDDHGHGNYEADTYELGYDQNRNEQGHNDTTIEKKTAGKKKSKWRFKSKNKKTKTVTKKRECCTQRLKKYLGIWSFFLVCIAIGIILMSVGVILPGVIIFLIGLGGIFCSGWCFRKCGSSK